MPDINRPDTIGSKFSDFEKRLGKLERGDRGSMGLRAQTIRITDEQGVIRVWLGLQDDGTYGLRLWDGTGQLAATSMPTILGTFSFEGTLAVKTGTLRLYAEMNYAISAVRASVNTPSGGAPITVDLLKGGATSILSGGPISIPPGVNTARVDTVDSPVLPVGDFLIPQITGVGSSPAGSDLTVNILARPT